MTAFYSTGTVEVTNGSSIIYAEDPAIWISANVKQGDTFELTGILASIAIVDLGFDEELERYWVDIGVNYDGASDTGLPYKIIKTSSEWGTNQTLAEQTAALIQAFAAGQITEEQLNEAVAAAVAAQLGAEAALATMNATYLGPQASDPTVDLNGNAVTAGQFYYNTVSHLMRVRGASSWSNMAAGSQGIQGIGAGIQYVSMTSTTDSDPGTGNFRFDNTDHSLATKAWLDNSDVNSVSMAAVIDTWGTGTSAIKGHLFVYNRTNRAIFRFYEVTGAVVDKTGYREVPLNYITGSGTLSNGTSTELVFIPYGDKGDTGDHGHTAGVPYTFSTTTTDADPGAGIVRFSSATHGSITHAYFDSSDSEGNSQTSWLDSLDDVANANARGYLRGQDPTDPSIFVEFAVTGAVVDGGGYRKVPVSPISGVVPSDAQELVWTFAPSGLDGIGVDGTDPGILFNYSTTITDGNPGSGFLRLDNATLTSATQIFINKSNRAGSSVATFLAGLADSTNPTYKGKGSITRASDGSQLTFKVTGITDASTYVKVAISSVGGATTLDNNDPVSFQFYPAGDAGASGAGTFSGPAGAVEDNFMSFDDATGNVGKDSGYNAGSFAQVANNGSDFDDKQEVFDNISLKGADVASATTVDLDAVSGSLIHITGTTTTTAITLTSGRYRRLIADAAWPITAGANLVLNNGGSNYTCAAGDQIDVFADGTVIRLTITPAAGASPGAMPIGYLDTDAALTADSDVKVPSQKAIKSYVDSRGTTEIGIVADFAGSTAPAKWLLCYGQNVSRTTYADLFTVIGTTYGAGDGSTTFALPDLRGRVVAGKDNMGGTSANRLTSPLNGDNLGATGGTESVTLTTTEMPIHNHGITDPGHNHTQNSHNHTQNSHNHTQNSHNHTQSAHQHHVAADVAVSDGTPSGSEYIPRAKNGSGGDQDYIFGGVNTVATVGLSSSEVAVNVATTATNIATTATNIATTATNNATDTNITINNAGSGGAHLNLQPTIVLNKIIYAGV